jgi:putative molybdopterin biosynthesis protein
MKMSRLDALSSWQKDIRDLADINLGSEEIATIETIGRVTSACVMADDNAPSYASAAMDGIAVKSENTFGATENTPLQLTKPDFQEINTGNPIPEGFDAVIKIEETNVIDEKSCSIYKAVSPWQHVRQIGENAVKNTMLLPSNYEITPEAAALLLSAKVLKVRVKTKPKVLIIPTGDELTSPTKPEQGKVPEYNSTIIAGKLREWGAEPTVSEIIPDVKDELREALIEGTKTYDLIIINAGSSAGTKDFTADVVSESGKLSVHGVEIRPGKPMLLGVVNKTPVAGLPGYPLAALTDLKIFIRPLVESMSLTGRSETETIDALLSTTLTSHLGDEEYIPGIVATVSKRTVFHPLPRGSSYLVSAIKANCLLRIPANEEGISQGEKISVTREENGKNKDNTIVAAGSHDLLLDLISDELAKTNPELSLTSIHTGSMGGIRSFNGNWSHLGGIHLLDEETGTYNEKQLKTHLDDGTYRLVHLCRREQGIIVQKGNPLNIRSIRDLTKTGLTFANRQRGSGTRILLDIKLKEEGINGFTINGFEREETTHIGVALRVFNGFADCGLGIKAAANAIGADFVPLESETYDLLVNCDFFDTQAFDNILQIIRSHNFREKAESFGGYDLKNSGEVKI